MKIEDFFETATYFGIFVPAAIQRPLVALAAAEPFVFSCVRIEDFFEMATYSQSGIFVAAAIQRPLAALAAAEPFVFSCMKKGFFETAIYIFRNFCPCSYTAATSRTSCSRTAFMFSCMKIKVFFEMATYIFCNFFVPAPIQRPLVALAAAEPFVFSSVQIEKNFRDSYIFWNCLSLQLYSGH